MAIGTKTTAVSRLPVTMLDALYMQNTPTNDPFTSVLQVPGMLAFVQPRRDYKTKAASSFLLSLTASFRETQLLAFTTPLEVFSTTLCFSSNFLRL